MKKLTLAINLLLKILAVAFVLFVFIQWLGIMGIVRADEIDFDKLIPCIIEVESGGDPSAVGKAGEIGLMQISPIVLKEYNKYAFYQDLSESISYGVKKYELYDIETNIKIGKWYLKRLNEHYLKDVYCNWIEEYQQINLVWKKDKWNNRKFKINSYKKYNIFNGKDYKLALILLAWNGGITRLRKYNYDINRMPRESREFCRKVLGLYYGSNKSK